MQINPFDFDHRVKKARRLFEEGRDVPPQLLDDSVVRSWQRSRHHGLCPVDRVIFNVVSRTDVRRIGEHHHLLLDDVAPEMELLFHSLGRANWILACIEAGGVVIHALGNENPACRDLAPALRVGVNLNESVAGTNGPGCALAEGRPSVVCGSEHFLDEARVFACAAVPVRDPYGELVAVLDASRRHGGHRIGILEPVALAVRAIENRMMRRIGGELRLAIHYRPELTDSPMRGLLHFDGDGCLLGANPVARQMLDLPMGEGGGRLCFETLFEGSMERVWTAGNTPVALSCHGGLQLFCRLEGRPSPRFSGFSPSGPTPVGQPDPQAPFHDDPGVTGLLRQAQRAFHHDLPVLLRGETGTGKEVMARWLHRSGPRAEGPFVAVNCSSIPAGLIESELFGYEGGAFTGARKGGMPGKFEQADGGTLFLDEIGDMPLELQARLLRVLQEREVTRLGATRGMAVQCSLICATHRDLEQRVAEGLFREDLLYRINGLQMPLPPLRQRQDFDDLVRHLLAREAGEEVPPVLSDAAWAALRGHSWPGNIRELQQALKLAVALSEDGAVMVEHLPAPLRALSAPLTTRPPGTLQRAECETVRAVLARHKGNVSAAAKDLGIARATLYRKMRQFGLN